MFNKSQLQNARQAAQKAASETNTKHYVVRLTDDMMNTTGYEVTTEEKGFVQESFS